jgi:hypothetical protein
MRCGALVARQNSDDPQTEQKAYSASATGANHRSEAEGSLITRPEALVAVAAM